MEFKPSHAAFVTYPWLTTSLFTGILLLMLFFSASLFMRVTAWWLIAVFVAISLMTFIFRSIRYKKERYVIEKDRIIVHQGGLFSDTAIELIVPNFTNVKLTLPAIEHHLFRTGHLVVMSAGSGGATLQSVDDPRRLYEDITDLMRRNGFGLKKRKILQQEHPSTTGIVLQLIGEVFGAAVTVLIMLSVIVPAAFATSPPTWAVLGFFGLGAVIIIGYVVSVVVRFLDMKRRVYTVYDDTVTYDEGFLTEHHAIMPVENISDAQTNQGLIDQVIGLYDVAISCQGTGAVSFTNMENGKRFAETLDSILGRRLESKATGAKSEAKVKKSLKPSARSAYTASFKPVMKRLILPWLALLIIPAVFLVAGVAYLPLLFIGIGGIFFVGLLLAISTITALIVSVCTTYDVKESGVVERFEFLHRKVTEFSLEKVTCVIIKESFIDRMFGTFTIEFWSIGAYESLTFRAISKNPDIVPALMQKLGVKQEKTTLELKAEFSFARWVAAHLWMTSLIVAASVGAILISLIQPAALIFPLLLIVAIATLFFFRKKYFDHMLLRLFGSYVTFESGWLFRREYFSFYDDIKGISVMKYPLSSAGNLQFNIAGNRVAKTKNGTVTINNEFTAHYIARAMETAKKVDGVLGGASEKTLLAAKPSLLNSLTAWMPVYLIIGAASVIIPYTFGIPLLLLLIALVVSNIIMIRSREYVIEEGRVLKRWGIIYRKQISIVLGKVDALSTAQGFLNKIFSNGDVHIFTAGSDGATPELNLADAKEYRQIYDVLKKNY
jgi:uncharacterized membrane protein YdbT with pleckstrin-like domain